ncbi:hypothetical protein E2C01_005218 [Portunus trituberculatus]|uniref:Uncharacterized protein n=1 Tax=Portunus trituberculatus TaxID=210409 RepID=A0A5B7CRX9_PORTR|nr:hypothetical protein [Portunus trituberculatus]
MQALKGLGGRPRLPASQPAGSAGTQEGVEPRRGGSGKFCTQSSYGDVTGGYTSIPPAPTSTQEVTRVVAPPHSPCGRKSNLLLPAREAALVCSTRVLSDPRSNQPTPLFQFGLEGPGEKEGGKEGDPTVTGRGERHGGGKNRLTCERQKDGGSKSETPLAHAGICGLNRLRRGHVETVPLSQLWTNWLPTTDVNFYWRRHICRAACTEGLWRPV